jgi:ureidoacrylate peracid hydrolase
MKRYWEWAPVFKPDPKKTALLIIDMQNGFIEEGSPLEVPMAREQIPKIKELLNFCRENKIPVIFTKFCVAPDFKYPFYWEMAKQRKIDIEPPKCMFWEGKHETEIIEDLRPINGERVIKKCGYDAFANTELDQILHSLNVEYLIITGTVTNWCVDSTVRSAFHRFYKVIVAADGVSTYDHAGASAETWQQMELDLFAEAFGRVMLIKDIIKELQEGL